MSKQISELTERELQEKICKSLSRLEMSNENIKSHTGTIKSILVFFFIIYIFFVFLQYALHYLIRYLIKFSIKLSN